MKKKEESLQLAISRYIKLQYRGVIFTSESSGIRLNIGQAVRAKMMRSESGLPDMIILHPSGQYHGLCLELKNKLSDVFKKDGNLKKNDHVEKQAALLHRLSGLKYKAEFVFGFNHAKQVIDNYLIEKYKSGNSRGNGEKTLTNNATWK